MNKLKSLSFNIPVIVITMAGMLLFACSNHKVDLTPACNDIPATVSFHKNILPLFDTYCNTSGCHNAGTHAGNLNLEDSVAYAQLVKPGTGFIDTITPSFSILYAQMKSSTDLMPPSGQLDDCKLQLILKWLQQKAKNN